MWKGAAPAQPSATILWPLVTGCYCIKLYLFETLDSIIKHSIHKSATSKLFPSVIFHLQHGDSGWELLLIGKHLLYASATMSFLSEGPLGVGVPPPFKRQIQRVFGKTLRVRSFVFALTMTTVRFHAWGYMKHGRVDIQSLNWVRTKFIRTWGWNFSKN